MNLAEEYKASRVGEQKKREKYNSLLNTHLEETGRNLNDSFFNFNKDTLTLIWGTSLNCKDIKYLTLTFGEISKIVADVRGRLVIFFEG